MIARRPRDLEARLRGLTAVGRGLHANFLWDSQSEATLPSALRDWAAARPYDIALEFEGAQWTAARLNDAVDVRGAFWRDAGLCPGDVVAIDLPNCVEYIVELVALMRLGVVAALLPPQPDQATRATLLARSSARAVRGIDGVEFLNGPKRRATDSQIGDGRSAASDPARDDATYSHRPKLGDLAAYIFTSGTTGLPKPALVKHHRFYRAGLVMGGALQMSSADRLYCCLPLYHANAAVIALSCCIYARARLVLARSFSASRMLAECRSTRATLMIYIGELCRYLAAQPPRSSDRDHRLRAILGNGLRPDLWPVLRERFGIEQICEYYAATEGNAETLNLLGISGSVGPLLPWKMAVVEADPATGAIVRAANGRCRRVWPGRVGMLIGKITPRNEFAGYRDQEGTASKIARDVFRPGDAWFVTGDLVRVDAALHMYFVDRVGDTFRWHGENVSSQEVGDALRKLPGILDATVFGVEVSGHEGRAGMGCIVCDPAANVAVETLLEPLRKLLPSHAVPRFLRVVEKIATTGTLKHRKLDLAREGFGESVADPLWIGVPGRSQYQRLTRELRVELAGQRLRM